MVGQVPAMALLVAVPGVLAQPSLRATGLCLSLVI